MKVLEFGPALDQKRLLTESRYQSKSYACLDIVNHDNWPHRWRHVEVVRKFSDGSVVLWQFMFDHNKLEFKHYHRSIPPSKLNIDSKLLWRGLEVVEQYPGGYDGTTHIDLADIAVPADVAEEAKRKFINELERNVKLVYPD